VAGVDASSIAQPDGIMAVVIGVALVLVGAVVLLRLSSAARERSARRRADLLLHEHLSAQELAQLKRFGVLDVPSVIQPDRVYQVRSEGGRVLVYESGVWTMELCIQSSIRLPGAEHVLAHKVMIQAAEEDYLKHANLVWRRGQAVVSGRFLRLD
jgi:hypothetical protein